MRVFISWSGDRSRQIAEHLHKWLPHVIQSIAPYVSSDGIEKGARWASDLAVQLEGTHFGLVCLVPENTEAAWIQFEAGALSKQLDKGRVAPILFGVDKAKMAGNPLLQFQCTDFNRKDMLRLVQSIKAADDEGPPVKPEVLTAAFERNWDDLEMSVEGVSLRKVLSRIESENDRKPTEIEELTGLAREQMKRLIAMEEKLGQLSAADVVNEDRLVSVKFFDALLEFTAAARKCIVEIEGDLGRTDVETEHRDWSGSLRRLERVKGGVERLMTAARKAKEGGGSVQAVRSGLVDLRRSLAVLEAL